MNTPRIVPTTTDDGAIADLLIIGGGINGTGIARDAAGRGLRVVLCEKDDLAQGTSSRSSGLIHGGLRYLEYGQFRLVRESLHEREVLLRIAPIWCGHSASCCRTWRACARRGCCAWAFSFTTIWAAPAGCPNRARCACRQARRAPACARTIAADSCMPIAAPTTRAWSCTTHWARTRAAPRSSRAPKCSRRKRATVCGKRPCAIRAAASNAGCARALWSTPPGRGLAPP